ncbi:hypothetical protein [Thalassorhabdomicrobium marinisediminis]|nr:hypothetical protein [Thalassorhabdomicrobium marinisediminis]
MSKSIKGLCVLSVLVVMAACANTADVEEFVVIDPVPVTVEPTFNSKYN